MFKWLLVNGEVDRSCMVALLVGVWACHYCPCFLGLPKCYAYWVCGLSN